jgi:GT2 family glycosyltransferase
VTENVKIIYVDFNTGEYIKRSIKSFLKYFEPASIGIIIVNNGSEITEYYDDARLDLKVVYSPENLGFGAANNLAAETLDSNYICFLNPDSLFVENFISPILDFMNKTSDIGACGPMLLDESLSYQPSSGFKVGLFYEFLEAFFLINFVRKYHYRLFYKHKSTPVKVAWLSGACMIIRREVFKNIGGFNEEFFLNYEDIDLCRRLEDAGYRNYFFPHLKNVHKGLASQSGNYEKLVLSRYMSRLIFARNHYGVLTRVLVRFFHIAGLILRVMLLFFHRNNIENQQRFWGYKKALEFYVSSFNRNK